MEASKMAPESTLSGYVVLSYADKKAFDELGELRPEVFQYPGVWGEFIPLDLDVDDAMETALLQCTSATFEVTDSDTKWCVLKLSFPRGVIADMWQSGKLHWSASKYRLELWAPIKSKWLSQKAEASPQVEVIDAVLPRMYFEDWGDRVLTNQFWMQKSWWPARCEECKHNCHFTWDAEWRFGGGRYCAECWHAHCWNAGYIPGSLHGPALQQKKKALPASAVDGASDKVYDKLEFGEWERPTCPAQLVLQWPQAAEAEQASL